MILQSFSPVKLDALHNNYCNYRFYTRVLLSERSMKTESALKKPLLLILLFIVTSISCDSPDKTENATYDLFLQMLLSDSVPSITVGRYSEIQEKATTLDTRSLEEYSVSRIPGAIHVGYEEIRTDNLEHLSTDELIVVYCSVGYRSEKIGEILQGAGYRNVKNLYGGIFEWVNQHQPVVDAGGKTNHLHPYGTFWSLWISNEEIKTVYATDKED